MTGATRISSPSKNSETIYKSCGPNFEDVVGLRSPMSADPSMLLIGDPRTIQNLRNFILKLTVIDLVSLCVGRIDPPNRWM